MVFLLNNTMPKDKKKKEEIEELSFEPEYPTSKQRLEAVFLEQIGGMLKPITSVPTHTPRNFFEQIVLYDSPSGTDRLYIYVQNIWRYVDLT